MIAAQVTAVSCLNVTQFMFENTPVSVTDFLFALGQFERWEMTQSCTRERRDDPVLPLNLARLNGKHLLQCFLPPNSDKETNKQTIRIHGDWVESESEVKVKTKQRALGEKLTWKV